MKTQTKTPDLSGYVNAAGLPVLLDPNSASFKAAPRPQRDRPNAFHRGWLVEGYPPGFVAEAEAQARKACDDWLALTSQQIAEKLKEGMRQPKPWSLPVFMQSTRKKKVRARPFEIPGAAEVCADLARKAGWDHVEIVEQKREDPRMAQGAL
jgi:hypothetical protein